MKKGFYQNIGIYTDNFINLPKIKADLYLKPEDFIVEEIFPNKFCDVKKEKLKQNFDFSKNFIHATLVKKEISTFDACEVLVLKNHLFTDDISYCGLKDTKGLTAQRISIFNRSKKKLKYTTFKNFFLKDLEGSDKKLGVRYHQGNHFLIKVRNISTPPKKCLISLNKFKDIIRRGIPNFYGPQRFGIRQNNHKLGKLLLQHRYHKFIYKFLTETNDNESKEIRIIRDKIKKNLGNLSKCQKIIQGCAELADEKQLIADLMNKGELQAIRNMKLSKFFINSLSSHLFNLALSHYLKENKNKKVKNIKLEKIGGNTKFNRTNFSIYAPILKKEEIKLSDFKTPYEEFCVDGHQRNTLFFSRNFEFQIRKKDIILEFDLGIGEYASSFLDFIFDNRSKPKLN